MQFSAPRKCPDCVDGKKGEKVCLICRGSGWVQLVPAERPVSHETQAEYARLVEMEQEAA